MNSKKDILKIIKNAMPILAAINLFIWLIQIFNDKLFKFLDKFFGLIPHIFDKLTNITTEINNKEILMGYVYAGLFYILIFAIIYKIEKRQAQEEAYNYNDDDEDDIEKNPSKTTKPQYQNTIENKKNIKEIDSQKIYNKDDNLEGDINAFYGLLTFEVKYLDDKPIDNEMQKNIKHSYTKILVEKLKEKYGSVNYAVSDKVFFICNNVSLFNLFVRDIVQLNKVIAKISEKQMIKTALKLSFWASPSANPKKACSILIKINNLNYLNKVIVSKHIQKKFGSQLIKCFDFCPMGNIKLSKLNSKDEDIDMELFYLKTLDD